VLANRKSFLTSPFQCRSEVRSSNS
jgi:hypothetical protein